MSTTEFREPLQATADARGVARVDFTAPATDRYVITLAVVSARPRTRQPAAVLLVNDHVQAVTHAGGEDHSEGSTGLRSGDVFSVVWVGADPGAECECVLTGTCTPFAVGAVA